MTTTNTTEAAESIPSPAVRKRRGPSMVWLVPVVAAALGGWLAWKTYDEKGPTITIDFVDAAGLVSSTLERPIAPIAVTDEIQEAELARQLEELEQRGGGVMRLVARSGDGGNMEVDNESVRQMMEDRVRSMVFADEVPVIRNFAVDWSDRVWVERAERPGEPGPTDVLTADGGYLGTIASDGMRIPAAFGPDGLLAYVERDELDVQRIRVSRLEGDEALEAGGR